MGLGPSEREIPADIENEVGFRERLAAIISSEPFCHEVYFHEGNHERKFSVQGSRGYVDLYVRTNPGWPHHEKFPVVGIETKVCTDMGWLINAVEQVGKYSSALKSATYKIAGREVPPPVIFLVATPDSWWQGNVYCWNMPEARGERLMLLGAWKALTFLYERLLMRHGAALLKNKSFYTNMFGRRGAVTRYEFYWDGPWGRR